MVEKVIWTQRAQKALMGILEYWSERNKSKTYSLMLSRLIED